MILYENLSADAAFWFAAEEYIMRELKPDEPVLMLWITGDTLMIGANQIVKAEIDETYAREKCIDVVRRPSGGGTIFTDSGTLQYTVILKNDSEYTRNTTYDPTAYDPKTCMRKWLVEPLILTLKRLGVEAAPEGRNDVTINGKKISGLAQHIRHGYICSHGSLLYSTDLGKLARALTVDKEKIQTKAIASVSARVTRIADHLKENDVQKFRETFIESYKTYTGQGQKGTVHAPCSDLAKVQNEDGSFIRKELAEDDFIMKKNKGACIRKEFNENDLKKIEEIKHQKYRNDEWTYGHEPAFTYTNKKRFPGGQVEVFLDVKGGLIKKASLKGDFLALSPVCEIEEALAGIPHREGELRETLSRFDVRSILGSINEDELLKVLI